VIHRCARPRRSVQNGFTLVELLIGLAILGILSMVAVPSMNNMIRDARLSAQTDLLIHTLNVARLEAVKQRTSMTVCPAANPDTDNACSASATDWANGIMVSDGAAITQRIQGKRDMTVNSNAAVSVVFAGTIGSATAATFTLCVTGRREQQVNVAVSGRISKQINATVCP